VFKKKYTKGKYSKQLKYTYILKITVFGFNISGIPVQISDCFHTVKNKALKF